MANIALYRESIQKLLTRYAGYRTPRENVELQKIFDPEHDHYQLMYVGWKENERIFGVVMHIDLKGSKVWIQWNGTEDLVADDLMALGVKKDDIVLGFLPVNMREFSEYALG